MAKVKTSWKPGQSGNPKGGPKKGYSVTEWFKGMLASNPEIMDALGNSIMEKALEGDAAAQKLVWSYMDGMPTQKFGGDDDSPIRIDLTVALTKAYGQKSTQDAGEVSTDGQ